jgi:hypothetical protein
MGLSHTTPVSGTPDLTALLSRLAAAGLPSSLIMIDGQLVHPRAAPPSRWQDARLKTPAGTVALKLADGAVSVTVFGNADPALLAAQETISRALGTL